MMYNGSTAPSGWAICNGQNGTPDLRNRFIVGTGAYNLGNTGGANSVTLTATQMPNHAHGLVFRLSLSYDKPIITHSQTVQLVVL